MRYFDLVTIINGETVRRCYVGLGKHSLFFMRVNWDALIHKGGEIPYAFILKVVEDEHRKDQFMLFLSPNRSGEWASERLYIHTVHRSQFIRHLTVNWQTDIMWRLGKIRTLPQSSFPLSTEGAGGHLKIVPFLHWCWKEYQDYRFMLPACYESTHSAMGIQRNNTGEYICKTTKCSLMVQVHEELTLDQARCLNRDHIRWVVAVYKEKLLENEKDFYVLLNRPYQKKMNLAGDIASWSAWELMIRTRETTLILILLRRQYLPPVCNGSQDIALIFKIPDALVRDNKKFNTKVREARLIADSICTVCSSFQVYRPIVMSKLDSLLYEPEDLAWVRANIKLAPKWRRQAKMLLRHVIRSYIEDRAVDQHLAHMLTGEASHYLVNAASDEAWADLPHLPEVPRKVMSFLMDIRDNADGLPKKDEVPEGFQHSDWEDECRRVHNQWYFRLARYIGFCLDGGLIGARFTIEHLVQGLPMLKEDNQKRASSLILFMLHIRVRHMKHEYVEANRTQLRHICIHGTFDNSCPYDQPDKLKHYMFNEAVLMALLNTEYIKKSVFSVETLPDYYKFLTKLILGGCSVEMKVFVCRMFVEIPNLRQAVKEDALMTMVPTFTELLCGNNAYLATYACAVLVNFSCGDDFMKTRLIASGIAESISKQIRSKDDDLACYVLMLLANLTKENDHRFVMYEAEMPVKIYDMLTSTYQQAASATSGVLTMPGAGNNNKIRILTQLCIIIGQFCNDPPQLKRFAQEFDHTVPCLVFVLSSAVVASPLAVKAIFALKQLCIHSNGIKIYIQSNVGKKLVDDYFETNQDIQKTTDFYNQTTLLFQVLCQHRDCFVALFQWGLTQEHLQQVLHSNEPAISKAHDCQDRIRKLAELVETLDYQTI